MAAACLRMLVLGCTFLATIAGTFESGLMLVNETTNSQMFYWYFPAQSGDESAPLILWLQGGPGASGLVGLFHEIGPFSLTPTTDDHSERGRLVPGGGYALSPRSVTWAKECGLLFVDNPVGTGFSTTGSESGYASSELGVSRDLWALLQGFYTKYPALAHNKLYVFGESYGGHYAPELSAYILQQNQRITTQVKGGVGGEVVVPLSGLGIGDGLTYPAVQVLTKPLAAYGFGLINGKELLTAQGLALQASLLARQGKYSEAKDARQALEDLITRASGVDLHDVRVFLDDALDLDGPIAQWANSDTAKAALNLPPDATWHTQPQVEEHLKGDVMRSSAQAVITVLDEGKLPVLLYQGQFDCKDGVAANQAWIQTLNWSGRSGWLSANRTQWLMGGKGAGWVQQSGLLTQVVVQGAGHLLPMNQPERALDMLTKFIHSQPPGGCPRHADQVHSLPPPLPPPPPPRPHRRGHTDQPETQGIMHVCGVVSEWVVSVRYEDKRHQGAQEAGCARDKTRQQEVYCSFCDYFLLA